MSIIKAMGMDEIFFFDKLNPSGTDILRGSKPSPRGCKSSPALFSREFSNYMFYDVNISQTMHGQPVRLLKSMNGEVF